MYKGILIGCVLFCCLSFYVKRFKNPPGTVKIYENLYADKTEISNFSWLEFEYDIKRRYGVFSKEHLAVIPDTSVWLSYPNGDLHAKNYYRREAYWNYPVVGISYEQALLFCKWRTLRVKQYYALGYRKELKINYRLPKETEWEFLVVNPKEKNSYGDIVKQDSLKRFPITPLTIYANKSNLFNIYNLIGNVSEMVEQKGISKGGSYLNTTEESLPGKQHRYQSPQAWLGFRCVCDYTTSM